MYKKFPAYFLIMLMILISACDTDRDKVTEIAKDGAIETIMNVEHLNDQLDVVKTTHKIWVKNILVKTVVHADTIPSLGLIKDQTENAEGETKEVSVKKDYEFYITVK